jgi:uncharacterized RDD family membrane protein YckC
VSVADRPRHAVRVMPPEAEERQGSKAGCVSRLAAMALDAAWAGAVVGLGYALWAAVRLLRAPRSFAWPQVSAAAIVVAGLLVAVVMLTASWTATGRSPGARLMGLRVVGPDGHEPPRLGRAFVRAVACVAFPIGLVWSAVSRRNASVQDELLRTSVVYDWHERN